MGFFALPRNNIADGLIYNLLTEDAKTVERIEKIGKEGMQILV